MLVLLKEGISNTVSYNTAFSALDTDTLKIDNYTIDQVQGRTDIACGQVPRNNSGIEYYPMNFPSLCFKAKDIPFAFHYGKMQIGKRSISLSNTEYKDTVFFYSGQDAIFFIRGEIQRYIWGTHHLYRLGKYIIVRFVYIDKSSWTDCAFDLVYKLTGEYVGAELKYNNIKNTAVWIDTQLSDSLRSRIAIGGARLLC